MIAPPPNPDHQHALTIDTHMGIAEKIVVIYEESIKGAPVVDMWNKSLGDAATGREVFKKQVCHYVAKELPVHFTLPAFPCKSGNLYKVLGPLPDKGERLALESLKLFADQTRAVYEHGAHITVVSDGHVFADLGKSPMHRRVGTDDLTVDAYNSRLIEMANQLDPGGNTFSFAGLDDLLHYRPEVTYPEVLSEVKTGPLKTFRSEKAERGRRQLLWQFGKGDCDNRLEEDPALLSLCRGFSRFVFEDTLTHPSLVNLSTSKRKAIAWKTGKLMILRNEAYSRLVQVCFPDSVRLSIHPHNNAGPKFGISLIHARYRARAGPKSSEQHFHTPTPWHNVALQLPDGSYTFFKMYQLVNLAHSEHQVRLVEPADPLEGAYFQLIL